MLTRRAFLQRLAKITAGSAGAVALSRLPLPEDAQHAAFLRGEGPRHFAGATLSPLSDLWRVGFLPESCDATFLHGCEPVLPRGYEVRYLNHGGVVVIAEMPMPDFKIDMIEITSGDSHGRMRQYVPMLPDPMWTPPMFAGRAS